MFTDLYRLTDLSRIDARVLSNTCRYLLESEGIDWESTVDSLNIDKLIPNEFRSSKLYRVDGKLHVTVKDGEGAQLVPIINRIYRYLVYQSLIV